VEELIRHGQSFTQLGEAELFQTEGGLTGIEVAIAIALAVVGTAVYEAADYAVVHYTGESIGAHLGNAAVTVIDSAAGYLSTPQKNPGAWGCAVSSSS